MDVSARRRNSWLACPGCGHKLAKVRTCDIEFKCKHCGHEFEVIIRSLQSTTIGTSQALEPERPSLS